MREPLLPLPRVQPRNRPEPLPASSAQARLWLLNEIDGPSATYNVPLVWWLDGIVDAAALEEALRDVMTRHETLRTVFGVAYGRPVQRVLDLPRPGGLLSVRDVPATDLDRVIDEACCWCFDLGADLPLRAWIFHAGDRSKLVLLVHHIAVDGLSLGPLLGDLGTAYAARLTGHEPPWTPLPVQYADYSLWQRELLGGGPDDLHPALRADLDHWRSELRAAPALAAVRTDRPRPADDAGHPSGLVHLEISPDVHLGLLRVSRACRTTLFVSLHAAVALLLREHGSGPDVHVGVAIAGRDTEELDDLVGMFVNTVVLRADVADRTTFRELVTQLAGRDAEALAHGRVPFDVVVGAVGYRRADAPSAGFQVLLGLEQGAPAELVLSGIECTMVPTEADTAKCELDISFVGKPPPTNRAKAGLTGTVQFDLTVLDRITVERLVGRLVKIVDECAERPDEPWFAPSDPPSDLGLDGATVAVLVELFAAALDRAEPQIGLDDSFFALGGDRLRATRLVNRMRVALDVEVELADLEQMPTVGALAAWLAEV